MLKQGITGPHRIEKKGTGRRANTITIEWKVIEVNFPIVDHLTFESEEKAAEYIESKK